LVVVLVVGQIKMVFLAVQVAEHQVKLEFLVLEALLLLVKVMLVEITQQLLNLAEAVEVELAQQVEMEAQVLLALVALVLHLLLAGHP
jgi:hypothetical protein